jgi:hypothetical protein
VINGTDGTSAGTSGSGAVDPGAGGGGAGRVRINTTSGAATISGMISPATTTSCVSQGALAQ